MTQINTWKIRLIVSKGGILENYQFPFEAGLRLGLKEDELKLCNKTQRMTLDTILQAIVKAKELLF